MRFTAHAVERFRQFHMLDRPGATNDGARELLEGAVGSAVNLRRRTHRGDPVWALEALGIELVVKHEDGEDIAITVLPPPRFRGLTPLQAEAVADSLAMSAAKITEVEAELAIVAASPPAAVAARREAGDRAQRLSDLKKLHHSAIVEREILSSVLRTMRTQLSADRNLEKTKAALKIAVRCLLSIRDPRSAGALSEIAEIDAGLASHRFAHGEDV